MSIRCHFPHVSGYGRAIEPDRLRRRFDCAHDSSRISFRMDESCHRTRCVDGLALSLLMRLLGVKGWMASSSTSFFSTGDGCFRFSWRFACSKVIEGDGLEIIGYRSSVGKSDAWWNASASLPTSGIVAEGKFSLESRGFDRFFGFCPGSVFCLRHACFVEGLRKDPQTPIGLFRVEACGVHFIDDASTVGQKSIVG